MTLIVCLVLSSGNTKCIQEYHVGLNRRNYNLLKRIYCSIDYDFHLIILVNIQNVQLPVHCESVNILYALCSFKIWYYPHLRHRHHHQQQQQRVVLIAHISLTFSLRSPPLLIASFLAGPLDIILCSHRADVFLSLICRSYPSVPGMSCSPNLDCL